MYVLCKNNKTLVLRCLATALLQCGEESLTVVLTSRMHRNSVFSSERWNELTLCFLLDFVDGFSAAGVGDSRDGRLCFTFASLGSLFTDVVSKGSCPGILESKLRSIFTHRDLSSSYSLSGDRSSFCTIGIGEKSCSSKSLLVWSMDVLLPLLVKLLTLRMLLPESFTLTLLPDPVQAGNTLACKLSSWSVFESEVDESVSMNSRDLGTILLGPLYFFFSEVRPVLVRGSFLGAVFPTAALVRTFGCSGGSCVSFSLGVLLVLFGLGQLYSSTLEVLSTFLGCFFPVVLCEVGSLWAGDFCLELFASGVFWATRGLAFSRMGLRITRSLESVGGRLLLSFPLFGPSACWLLWAWELVSLWGSFWLLMMVLLWGFTLFSHLSSCHLFVEGGSGCSLKNDKEQISDRSNAFPFK